MKLTPKAAQAFASLRGSPDFLVLLEWVKENRTKFRDECCTALDDAKVKRSQGKVEAVNGFIQGFEEAPALMEKLKHQ